MNTNLKDLLARVVLPLLMLVSPGCEKPEKLTETGSAPFPNTPLDPTFPIEREITDVQGRKLNVSIVGKTGNDIFLTRKSDGNHFRLAISRLSPGDREFVRQLPSIPPPRGLRIEGEETQNISARNSRYIAIRREKIQELKAEKSKLYEEAKVTSNRITMRTNYSEIERIEKEIEELEADIDFFQKNNP